MAVGARDYIDKLLVKKYADEQVDNDDGGIERMVDPQKMLDAMNDVTNIQRNMVVLSQRLQATCYAMNAKARYMKRCPSRHGGSYEKT